jgi:phosphoribosylamine--glycine ligase
MPRVSSDLVELFEATASKTLDKVELETSSQTATTVVAVAGGYPGSYEKGKEISGLDQNSQATVFHAGTKSEGQSVVTNGGRVIAATGMGQSIQEALDASYAALGNIEWEAMNYRKDIGQDLLAILDKK